MSGGIALVLLGQEFHREMDSLEVAPRHWQIARLGRTDRERDGVKLPSQILGGDVGAHPATRDDLDALGFHLLNASFDLALFELEIGNPVAEQSSDTIIAFIQRHGMTCARKLLCASHPGRPGTHDGDLFSGLARIGPRRDPTLGPRVVDDMLFDLLDRDRVVVDVEDAGLLARRGTNPAGELGKIIRPMKALNRLAPAPAINQIVPVGNYIAERAAAMAKRNAAIHAARALLLQLGRVHLQFIFAIVPDALRHRPARIPLALDFHEAGYLAH
jgi:hypothetical protein